MAALATPTPAPQSPAVVPGGMPAPQTRPRSGPSGRLLAEARRHYALGNRLLREQGAAPAGQEWLRAQALWRQAVAAPNRRRRLRAALGAPVLLLATVLLVYNVLYTAFPRRASDEPEPAAMAEHPAGPWWQRLLDTGGGPLAGGRTPTLPEWWQQVSARWLGEPVHPVLRTRRRSLEERWEELLLRYGQSGVVLPNRLDYRIISGYGMSRLGEYAQAVQVFQQGIRRTRDAKQLADLYQGLASAYYYQGSRTQPDDLARYDLALVNKAAHAYELSIRSESRPLSYGNLGWMYYLLGKYDLARAASLRALALDGSLDYVRLNLGLILLVQGRVQPAYDAYDAVIRRRPDPDVYAGGISDLRTLLRDHPRRYPYGLLMLGLLAEKQGDVATARGTLDRFLRVPGIGEPWRQLARRLLQELPPAQPGPDQAG